MTWKRSGHPQAIAESEAYGATAALYGEIRSLLGVAQVPLLFRIYAAHGEFLSQFWEAVRPVVASSAFRDAARRLSADAYTRMHNYFEIGDARHTATASLPELTRVVELLQQQDGALLLLLSFAAEAFDNPVGRPAAAQESAGPLPVLLPTLPPAAGGPLTEKILEEARRQFGTGTVPGEFSVLAHWPGFLQKIWEGWKQIAASPLLAACQHGLLLHSIELAHALPGPVELSYISLSENGMGEEEFSELARLTRNWNQALTTLLPCISAAKIALEGGSGKVHPRPESEEQQATPTRAA